MNAITKKVYFAAAIRGDTSLKPIVQELIAFIRDELGFEVLSEHVGADNSAKVFAEKIGKDPNDVTDVDIERQDMAWLKEATHVIAEVSGASTGTGREVEFGRMKHLEGHQKAEVLCLHHVNSSASAMITGMLPKRYPNVLVQQYAALREAKAIIQMFLTRDQ